MTQALAERLAPWRDEAWATLSLALPLALTQLAQIAIQTTDVVMMGWLGPSQLAAGALGTSLYHPLFLFGLGILMAVAPIAAQALGGHQRRAVRRTVRQGFWVALTIAVPFCLFLWYARPFLLLIGQDPGVTALTEGYLRAALWGLPPALGVVVLRCFVTVHARPRSVLVVTLLGIVVNGLGNYALMFGHFGFPRLELVGAGISTMLVHAFMFLTLLAHAVRARGFRRYALLARFWRPDWPRYVEIITLGVPIGLTVLAEAGLFAAAAFLMGVIGTDALAAHAIALQCAAVAFMVPLGVGQAATVRVGLAVGAGDIARVGRAGWVSFALGAGFMSATAIVFWTAGDVLVGFFLPDAPPGGVAALAISFLAIAALFQLFDGAQVIGVGLLRGLKDTRVPMLIAVFGYWAVGFVVSAWLGLRTELAGAGVWFGLAAGLAVTATMLIWRFYRRERLIRPFAVVRA